MTSVCTVSCSRGCCRLVAVCVVLSVALLECGPGISHMYTL